MHPRLFSTNSNSEPKGQRKPGIEHCYCTLEIKELPWPGQHELACVRIMKKLVSYRSYEKAVW